VDQPVFAAYLAVRVALCVDTSRPQPAAGYRVGHYVCRRIYEKGVQLAVRELVEQPPLMATAVAEFDSFGRATRLCALG
jgi:hypothetical protein